MVTSLWGAGVAASAGEAPIATDPPWVAWRTETLDPSGASLNTETAVDEQGRLWVAHDDEPNVQLGLKYRDEEGWHEPDGGPNKGQPMDLAIGPEGKVWTLWVAWPCTTCISVYDPANDTWQRIRSPEDADDGRMAFGPNEEVLHAVWMVGHNPVTIQHAAYNLTTEAWSFENITKHGISWLGMTVGPEGRIHAAWTTSNWASTYAIRHLDGTWETTRTESCRHHAMTTGPEGTLHWVCSDNPGVIYKTRTADGEWSREVAQDGSELVPPRAGGEIGYSLDIALDDQQRPHIVYATQMNPFFRDDPTRPEVPVYAAKLESGWHQHTVDRDGSSAGFETSLGLDESGRPHISYARAYRVAEFSCAWEFNPCHGLRYAEPVSATGAWAGDAAMDVAS